MKHLITFIALICLLIFNQLQAELSKDELIHLLDGKPTGTYNLKPEDYDLPASTSGVIILNYDNAVIEGAYQMLEDESLKEYWGDAFRALRRIGTVDPQSVSLSRLIKQVERIEAAGTISSADKVGILGLAYPAVARHCNSQAFTFLSDRIQPEFWKNNPIEKEVKYSSAITSSTILTGQTQAIISLTEMQTNEASALFASLFEDSRFTETPHLSEILTVALGYKDIVPYSIETLQQEYAKRLEICATPTGIPPVVEVEEELVSEITPAPSAAEVEVEEPPVFVEEEPEGASTVTKTPRLQWILIGALLLGVFLLIGRFRPKA